MKTLILALGAAITLASCGPGIKKGTGGEGANGLWRASVENGDKPGIGIELRRPTGDRSGTIFVLDPNKPHQFESGVQCPMRLLEDSTNMIEFEVSFGEQTPDRMRLRFPKGLVGDKVEATLEDAEGKDTPTVFVFRKLH